MYSKEDFIAHVNTQGKGENTWGDLANIYGFCSGDAARKYYSRNKDQKPDCIPDSLALRSKWQVQKKGGEVVWLESYRKEDKQFVEELNKFKLAFLGEISNSPIPGREYKVDRQTEHIVEISIPDFHFGKHAGLTLEEQRDLFVTAIIDLFLKSKTIYSVDTVIIPLGNDIFNVDNVHYTTTKGTPQQSTDNWHRIFKVVWGTIVKVVDYILRQGCKVVLPIVSGNHDYMKALCLGEVLEARYSNNQSVEILNDYSSPRKYYSTGKLLFGYTHGDKEKREQLPAIMAVEAPQAFAKSTIRLWRLGHLHKHMKDEVQGIVVETMPSLVAADDWHKLMGYHSTKKAMAYVYNKQEGIESYFQYNKA